RDDLHGLLAGRLVRLLRDAERIGQDDAAAQLHRQLSVGSPAARKASWVEGFLAGGGMLLVHDRGLLELLDAWAGDIAGGEFTGVLPLLRRAFAELATGERRAVAEAVRRLGRAGATSNAGGTSGGADG